MSAFYQKTSFKQHEGTLSILRCPLFLKNVHFLVSFFVRFFHVNFFNTTFQLNISNVFMSQDCLQMTRLLYLQAFINIKT